MMRSALHPNEYRILNSLSPQQQMIYFSLFWTLKEALLKGKGVGIADPAQPTSSFDFSSITPKLSYWVAVMNSWILLAWIHKDSFAVSVAVEWDSVIDHADLIEIDKQLYIQVNESQIRLIQDDDVISF